MANNQSPSLQPVYMKPFEVCLTKEVVRGDVPKIDQVLQWPSADQIRTRKSLELVIRSAFPQMSRSGYRYIAAGFFKHPGPGLFRQTILLKNESGRLIAAGLFDQGAVEFQGKVYNGIYNILRAILPEYQGMGLGQLLASKILMELKPDFLMVTAYQSASLHSWVDLPEKGKISGYDVYPCLVAEKEGKVLKTLPYKDLHFALHAFERLFMGFVQDEAELIETMQTFSIQFVRKQAHDQVYDFHPWEKQGKKDSLANALGAGERDGVVIMFRKV